LRRTADFASAHGLSLYLVGGWIRDALLGRLRALPNIDLAVSGQALEIARGLAAHLGGTYVCLHEETSTGRVIVSTEQARMEVDLSDFRGPTLEADLGRRDFTVNAMAVPLEAWVAAAGTWQAHLIDPLHGRQDLEQRRLRACFPGTFRDDPLRILRGFRFAVELDFALDAEVPALMRDAAPELRRVSGERIRDELFAVFQTDRASWAVGQWNGLGILDLLCPELPAGRDMDQGGYHHLDVLGHELESVSQSDRMLSGFEEFSEPLRAPLAEYCRQTPVDRRSRKGMIKLACLYHDVGKPATRRVKPDGDIWFIGHEHFGASLVEGAIDRLKLSNQEGQTLSRLVLYHLRPGFLSREPQLTRRAVFRFFRDLGDDGPACLLLWWADRLATRGPLSNVAQIDQQRARLEELLGAYFFKPEEAVRPPRLIDGHQLMQALKLPAGPEVGRLLRAIEEAQAEGALTTRNEAIALARSLLAGQDRGAA